MKGKYRDLLALVEFGDQAYVITPFTTDYENILFSMSLIGDWTEFMAFPDQGTVIANAIDQSVGLFEAFDVLDAAGNAMVIFTDGIDAEVTEDGRDRVRRAAARRDKANIPVYFIRIGDAGPRASRACPTKRGPPPWRAPAASSTTPPTRRAIVRAVQEIDRAAPGRVEMKRYMHRAAAVRVVRARRPRCCGRSALAMRLTRAVVSDVSVDTMTNRTTNST